MNDIIKLIKIIIQGEKIILKELSKIEKKIDAISVESEDLKDFNVFDEKENKDTDYVDEENGFLIERPKEIKRPKRKMKDKVSYGSGSNKDVAGFNLVDL